jgi:hypothetical protein
LVKACHAGAFSGEDEGKKRKEPNLNRTMMEPNDILNQIAKAKKLLPLTTVRQAFAQHRALEPLLLEAVRQRAGHPRGQGLRQQRLSTFGLYFLAQLRVPQVGEPLVSLLEDADFPRQVQEEWRFTERLRFFGHRLVAGACPGDAERPHALVRNPDLRPLTRCASLRAIGLLAANGDISRAEGVARLRGLLQDPLRAECNPQLDCCWAHTAIRVHSGELQRELEWYVTSGRLVPVSRRDTIAQLMQRHPEGLFDWRRPQKPLVDLCTRVFPLWILDGEWTLFTSHPIPGTEIGPTLGVRPACN